MKIGKGPMILPTIFDPPMEMRTNFLYVFLCVHVIIMASSLASGEGVSDNYINSLTSRYSTVTIDDVKSSSGGYRFEAVIEKLRKMDEEYAASHSDVLIRLKDQQTIDKYLNLFVKYQGAHRQVNAVLAGSRAPWIVPELIALIGEERLKSQVHPDPEQAFYYGLSGASLMIVHEVISRSEDLPPAVREWALGINTRGEPAMNEAKTLYLDWWKLNEAAFRSEEYDKVIPLPEQNASKIESSSISPSIREAASPEPALRLATDERASDPEEGAEEVQEGVIVDSKQENDVDSSRWLLWLLGIVGVAGGFAFKFAAARKSGQREN